MNTRLEAKKTELIKEIKQKISLERKMKRLVAQYSHTLGNSLFPDLIYKVAEKRKGTTISGMIIRYSSDHTMQKFL